MSSRAPLWRPHWYLRDLRWLRRKWVAVLLGCSVIIGFCLPAWLSNHGYKVPVGVFVAVMGLVAAIMAFHKEPTRGEKALWTMCLTALVVAEIRNLYTADREQTATFNGISGRLDATKKGLDATKEGLDITAKKIGETTSGIGTLYSEATGGDSYVYLEIASISDGPLEIDGGGLKKGMIVGNTYPAFVGKFPLHNVYLSEFGPLGHGSEIDYGTIFPKELGRPRPSPYIYFYPDKPKQLFFFFISTSNGSYTQVVLVRKIRDKWLWASRFSKYGLKRPIRLWSAPGFPKEELKADWDKLK